MIGDLFLDRYLTSTTLTEPSIETGLDAYQVVRVRSYAGRSARSSTTWGSRRGTIRPIAFYGDDGEGYELQQALASCQRCRAAKDFSLHPVAANADRYTKPILVRTGEQPRELNRLDIKNRTPTSLAVEKIIIEYLETHWNEIDALIVLDQVSEPNCGVITDRVRARVGELAQRDPSKFILADSRERIREFQNVCVKPNQREAAMYPGGAPAFAMALGRHVFQTLGEDGIDLFAPDGKRLHVPAYGVNGPIDIVGAGDSTSAGIACAIMAGATFEQAAAFGNLVASITVQQIGVTGTATPDQVRERWRQVRAA